MNYKFKRLSEVGVSEYSDIQLFLQNKHEDVIKMVIGDKLEKNGHVVDKMFFIDGNIHFVLIDDEDGIQVLGEYNAISCFAYVYVINNPQYSEFSSVLYSLIEDDDGYTLYPH
jgi:hypothetical protein